MSDPAQTLTVECLIIGGGPAGLTAAIYLARFRRNVLVIDKGESRAKWIPTSHNYPGFVNGIHGEEFLKRLNIQAAEYGADVQQGEVKTLKLNDDGSFTAHTDDAVIHAQKIILATGVVDEAPRLPDMEELVYSGVIRFCPICDGFEATDKRVGILGTWDHVVGKSLFLRSYTADVTVLTIGDINCNDDERKRMLDAGIDVPVKSVRGLKESENGIIAVMNDGEEIELDILYPAMGAKVRSDLVANLNVERNDIGCVNTNGHQRTDIPGLYAIGDVTYDLSQISVATGQAAIAATDVHNSLPLNLR